MYENIKEKKIEIKFNIEKNESVDSTKLIAPNKETAPRVGIERRKDIFAASTLLKLNNRAAVMEIPDLLTPGTKERI